MPKKKVNLEIPEDALKEMEMDKDSDIVLEISNKQGTLFDKNHSFDQQNQSLRWFLIPSVVATLLFYFYALYQNIHYISITGTHSIATLTNTLGLTSGILCFTIAFVLIKKDKRFGLAKRIYWRNFPAILISFSIILFLCILLFFKVLGTIFFGLRFDIYTSTALFFFFVCIINYAMIYLASTLSPQLLIKLLTVVIVGGVLIAMATNSDALWWQHNFSFLGTLEANRRWQFNLTLILSAILMIALLDYLFVALKEIYPHSKKLFLLKTLLVLTALNLGGVGFFPYSDGTFSGRMHNTVAGNLVYLILLLILLIRWLLPNVSKEFLTFSYLTGVILFLTTLLFVKVHYLSLTAFELFAFLLAFSWLLLLLQQLEKIVEHNLNTYQLAFSPTKEE
ncbi:MAG: DUF998 domain-containing protein [Enterococcus sp.]